MAYKGKYVKPSATVGTKLMRLAFVLLCMVVLSVFLMGGLLARYSTTGSGKDEARVAIFQVNVDGTPHNGDINCTAVESGNGVYTIAVENQSEVSVHYTLNVEITGGDTKGISHKLDSDNGDLPPGETGHNTLTFTIDWNDFTADKEGNIAEATLNFTVTVDVAQID